MADLDFSGLNSSWGIGKQKSGDKNRKTGTGSFSSGKGGNYSKSSGKDGFQKNKSYQDKKGDHKNSQGSYKSNFKSGHKMQGDRGDDKYSGAPYNFVPFYESPVYLPKDRQVPHNSVKAELVSGEIIYKMTAMTPVFISDGQGQNADFTKNAYGEYAIPGSSVRGLIRNNVEILSLSSMADDIDDYRMMYRNVADRGKLDNHNYNTILGAKSKIINGNQVSVILNVKAGYIEKRGSNYVILRTAIDKISKDYGEMNYYVLNERKIIEDRLNNKAGWKNFSMFFENDGQRLQHVINKHFKEKQVRGMTQYYSDTNRNYKPYYESISYELHGNRNVTSVGHPGKYRLKGTIISNGYIQMKKAIYIIPEVDRSKEVIPIPEEDIRAFEVDYKKRENGLKPKEFFALPKNGEVKPIFYIQLGRRLYFGFSPRLRLFNEHTVGEGLNKKQKKADLDYAKSLFGYTKDDNKSYKSRVSFSDALLVTKEGKRESKPILLAEPKASSYADYLVQPDGEIKNSYNSDTFTLRGAKQYWLHRGIEKQEVDQAKRAKMLSCIKPIGKGAEFTGKVRFHNLTKDELGLLLWSLKLEDSSWMNIGMAKAWGYGAVKVQIISAKCVDVDKAYDTTQLSLGVLQTESLNIDEYIEYYKKHFEETNHIKLDAQESVKDFLLMKDSSRIPDYKNIRYMSLEKDKKEYQSRKKPLPTVQEVLELKKG